MIRFCESPNKVLSSTWSANPFGHWANQKTKGWSSLSSNSNSCFCLVAGKQTPEVVLKTWKDLSKNCFSCPFLSKLGCDDVVTWSKLCASCVSLSTISFKAFAAWTAVLSFGFGAPRTKFHHCWLQAKTFCWMSESGCCTWNAQALSMFYPSGSGFGQKQFSQVWMKTHTHTPKTQHPGLHMAVHDKQTTKIPADRSLGLSNAKSSSTANEETSQSKQPHTL